MRIIQSSKQFRIFLECLNEKKNEEVSEDEMENG